MKLVWSQLALDRLVEHTDYIAKDRLCAAESMVDGVFAAVERLKDFPMSGRVVYKLRREDIREILYGACRIIYRIEVKQVIILTIRHTRQLLDDTEIETSDCQ